MSSFFGKDLLTLLMFHVNSSKGPFINDVHCLSCFLDPLPFPSLHFHIQTIIKLFKPSENFDTSFPLKTNVISKRSLTRKLSNLNVFLIHCYISWLASTNIIFYLQFVGIISHVISTCNEVFFVFPLIVVRYFMTR